MYWTLSIAWFLGGLIVFWATLTKKWRSIDSLTLCVLRSARMFHPIPGDVGYWDLKFSVLRHTVFFLIASILFFFVKSDFVLTVVLAVSMLYHGVMPVQRYRVRKDHIASLYRDEESRASAEFCAIPVRDSFCVVVHAIITLVLTWILYAIRP